MKHVFQEQGYALLLVIFTTVIISVIGLGLLTMNAHSVQTSKNEEVDQAVYYIAEAGVNYSIEEINSLVESEFKDVLKEYNDITDIEEKNLYLSINPLKSRIKEKIIVSIDNYINLIETEPLKIFEDDNKFVELQIYWKEDMLLDLTSTGYIDNTNRTITQTLYITLDDALSEFEKTGIIGSPGGNPPGSSSDNYLIADPNHPKNTPLYVNKPLDKNKFKFGVGQFSNFDPNSLLSIEDFNSKFIIPNNLKKVEAYTNMIIKESMKINNFANALSNSNSIKIDASDNDITIYISGGFNPNIPFEIVGKNKVNIILTDGMTINEGFKLTKSNGVEVNMFVKGTANFNTGNGNDVLIQSNIIALNSTFNLDSNKLKVDGNLITYTKSDINVNGSNNSYIRGLCAPYAKINVNGTYNINGGSIIVNELNYNGQASLNYLGNATPTNACTIGSSINNGSSSPIKYYDYEYDPGSLIKLDPLIEK